MSMYGMREGGGAGEWIMGAVTRNPEGLLLLAAGVALLMRSGRAAKGSNAQSMSRGGREYAWSREYRQTSEGVDERLGEAARRAGEYVSKATDQVAETTRAYASSVAEYAEEASQAAMEGSRRMAEQARETADYLVREQPWAVALAGLLAGSAVASVFPATRIEKRTLGEAGQRIRSAAGRMGEQLVEAGMQAGERLSEVAEERGLTRQGLKQAAQDVGETFRSALSGEEEPPVQSKYRQKPGEGAGSRTQTRPAQPGAGGTQPESGQSKPGSTQSNTASKFSGSASGMTPGGGRR